MTQEERYAVEAGAYLAYKPAASAKVVGNAVVVRPADETFPRMTDFTPDVEGLYVFRRSIGVGNDTKETFKYDGYYYKNGAYYKISNLTYSLASAANLGGDNVNDDGNLASASAGFVEVKTIVANPTSLEYVELENNTEDNTEAVAANVEKNKKYLVAKYNIGSDNAQTKLKALAEAYDKAIHDFEYAEELVNAATTKSGSSSDETDVALNVLNGAKDVYDQAIADYDAAFREDVAAKKTLANAEAAKDRAVLAYTEAESAYNTAVTDQSAARQAITDAGYTGDDADDAALNTELEAWWSEVHISEEYNRGSLTVEQLEAFKTYIDDKYGTNAEKHTHYTLLANKAIADRKVADAGAVKNAAESTMTQATNDYNAAYEAVNSVSSLDPDAPIGDANTSFDGTNKRLQEAEEAKNTAKDAYDGALDDYKTKLAASNADTTQLDNATKALAAATAAKEAAATAYTTAAGAIGSASDGQLKIWIKLSDDVNTFDGSADKWQMLPDSVDPTTNKAVFYYNTILEGGETSSKLIDSVSLDARTTQDMYKYFDFDLNVALDSVQVNYADDGKLLAGGTASELGASVTFTDDTDVNAPLTWS